MSDYSSDSDLSDNDRELQEAFEQGKLKPGLNIQEQPRRVFANKIKCMKQKLEEFAVKLPWIERLDNVNEKAPLAPELAAQMMINEQKRENQLKNNKKLPQTEPSEDPVLNDFKREIGFYRQAQAAVLDALPKLKAMNLPTKRPDDYFAEMAKTDEHMQKIREKLMRRQHQQQRSEQVKQLRQQRKEGKMLQIQTKLKRQQEKKQMQEQIKKYKKGVSKNLDLEPKQTKTLSRKVLQKRNTKNKKFGFGGKKRGSKLNTKDSAADIQSYRRPSKNSKSSNKSNGNKPRLGKSRRMKNKKGKN